MYAQLGNIKFETLVGFESLNDTRATNFAEHPLIEGKPRLQRVGTNLQELTFSISFHINFCSPEDEYDKLNNARENAEVLTLVYGNGYVEGDFVIVSVGRKVNQTDGNGNYVHITCDVTLKEYTSASKIQAAQSRAKLNAFAVDVNRPLPVNTAIVSSNPATDTFNSIQDAKKQAAQFERQTNRLKDAENKYNPIIDKAQAFRDRCQIVQSKLNGYIDKINAKLAFVQDVVNWSDIETLCPNIQAQINACNSVTSQASSIITQFVSFPAVVNTAIQATAILTTAQQTYGVTNQLKEELTKLEDSVQALGGLISSRRKLS